jgi:putative hemolysin
MQRKPEVIMRRHSLLLTAVVSLAALMVGACGDDNDAPTNTTTAPAIANPASEYCVAQGGTVEIVDEAGGQVGYCNLTDGSRVEEWEYFREQTGSTVEP